MRPRSGAAPDNPAATGGRARKRPDAPAARARGELLALIGPTGDAVVLHDARGVRQEAGKQAVTITAIIDHLIKEGKIIELPEWELKELIGHTPLQVLIGSIVGVGVGLWLG